MINKEELLNQIDRLNRYKQRGAFLNDFDAVSLHAATKAIEDANTGVGETEEMDIEEAVYNVIHAMASAKRGMDRALDEITGGEKLFVLQMLRSMRNDK